MFIARLRADEAAGGSVRREGGVSETVKTTAVMNGLSQRSAPNRHTTSLKYKDAALFYK